MLAESLFFSAVLFTIGVVGVLTLYSSELEAYTADHLRILMALAPRIGTAVENALKYREMEEKANTDFVTGLPNLHLMMKALESELGTAKRHKQSLGLTSRQLNSQVVVTPASRE